MLMVLQLAVQIPFTKIIYINYSIIVLLSFIIGFIPIILSKYIISKNKYTKFLVLGKKFN